MSNAEAVGGLLGTLMTLGVILWGVEKVTGALDSKKEKEATFSLDNTEPF